MAAQDRPRIHLISAMPSATECGANTTSGFFRPSRTRLRAATAGSSPVWPLRILEAAHRANGILRRRSRWSQPWSKIVPCGVQGSLYCLRLKSAQRPPSLARQPRPCAPVRKNPFDLIVPAFGPAGRLCLFPIRTRSIRRFQPHVWRISRQRRVRSTARMWWKRSASNGARAGSSDALRRQRQKAWCTNSWRSNG